MSSKNATMEAALLEIAKDLLQASDDLASTDPSASAKLAHEAYEIGRGLGIVRSHLDGTVDLSAGSQTAIANDEMSGVELADVNAGFGDARHGYARLDGEDESDAELSRILDRQKAMLPKPVELAPVRKPSRSTRSLTFESAPPKRSGWLGWMRPREWRHAG